MKFEKELAIAIFVLISAQMLPADGISISVGGDAGGFNEDIQANINDRFDGSTILTADSLSDTIAGSGSIKKRFFSNPSSIGSAEVGFDIKNAKSYSYDHYVDPDYSSVSDTLDVSNADKITAYASAYNSRGDRISASTTVSGTRNGASLHGYSGSAIVWQTPSNILAKATQEFESASGDIIQTNEWAKRAEGDAASSGLSVVKGSLEGYVGGAYTAVDLEHYYDPEWFYESGQAYASRSFNCPSAAKIQTEENARNAEGYKASSGIEVKSGSMDSYYGAAYSGLAQTYGEDLPSGKHAYATVYNDIFGLSGAKIQAYEKATDIVGDMAISRTDIAKGFMEFYSGSADASLIKKEILLSPESRYASVSHSIERLTGIKAQIDEKAFDTKGIFTGTSTSLGQGSIGSYSGNAEASLVQWDDPMDNAFARSYAHEISGKRLDLGAVAINAEGIMKHNSTKLKNPASINFENRAEVNLGIPSIYQGQI
jgi:hypothetical protein